MKIFFFAFIKTKLFIIKKFEIIQGKDIVHRFEETFYFILLWINTSVFHPKCKQSISINKTNNVLITGHTIKMAHSIQGLHYLLTFGGRIIHHYVRRPGRLVRGCNSAFLICHIFHALANHGQPVENTQEHFLKSGQKMDRLER